MSKICYHLQEGLGEWTALRADNEDTLEFIFTPQSDGYIKICDTVYRVKSGRLSVPSERIRDGEHELRLECDGESFLLEGFSKSGNKISMLKTKEETIRSLLKRSRTTEQRLKAAEEKISILLGRTEGHHIFN